MLPTKLIKQKIQKLFQISSLALKIMIQNAIAGFTGLAPRTLSLVPATSIAAKYEPARMIVWTAASFVNLVFSSVDDRYMKTKKKEPRISTITCWIISPSGTYSSMTSAPSTWPVLKMAAKILPRSAPINYAAIYKNPKIRSNLPYLTFPII